MPVHFSASPAGTDKELLQHCTAVSIIHEGKCANYIVSINGKPEVPAVFLITGSYIQQIRLLFYGQINSAGFLPLPELQIRFLQPSLYFRTARHC